MVMFLFVAVLVANLYGHALCVTGNDGGSAASERQGQGFDISQSVDPTGLIRQLLSVFALGLLILYLVTIYNYTSTSGRKRRDAPFLAEVDNEVTLDGPAWLSMIHELWQQDAVADDPSCAYHTLCRMNRIAAESGGQGTWAAHLSSVPLSYLLHHRHEAGFLGYMDASLQGKTGANCSSLFSGCSRLQ